jgi:hypothetical protein
MRDSGFGCGCPLEPGRHCPVLAETARDRGPASRNDNPAASGNAEPSDVASHWGCGATALDSPSAATHPDRELIRDKPTTREGKKDVSIIASRRAAVETAESAGAGPAILPVAAFIVVQILLAAETIWVILLKEMAPRSPAAAPLAILLSVALLANLGLVCSAAAAVAADAIRRSNRPLSGSFASVGADADGAVGPGSPSAPPAMPASG